MPVRMTEISPQTPSGANKIDVKAGTLIAETSFDVELDLATDLPIKKPVESRNFTQVGKILQKILPLELRLVEAIEEPPTIIAAPVNINAEVPLKKLMGVEPAPSGTPQMADSGTAMREVERAAIEPQTVEVIPLESTASGQNSSPILKSNVPENPSAPEISVTSKLMGTAQISEHQGRKMPEETRNGKHAAVQPPVNTLRSGASTQLDTGSKNLTEPSLQSASDVQHDIGDFVVSISDKPQVLRSLPSAVPVAQLMASRPQIVEAKIVSLITTAISKTSKDTVEIRLDPPELGRVTISISQTDSGLSATVISEKAEIADLLRRHAELLSLELSKSGFNDASLEFSHRDQRQDQPTFEGDKAPPSPISPEQTEVTSTIEMILRSQSGSLDIRL